ncbi:hypothetical protein AB0B54_24155 [Microbispora bryophytorum]|uniref:hypothetical protein n=1 Tax=Microbispora bryophytorum TaxID=1460882 RepID=UPI0033F568D7
MTVGFSASALSRPRHREEYDALPEEIAKAIEIVDGYVVYCAAPTPDHQTAGRRLANLLERHARAAMRRGMSASPSTTMWICA